MQPRPLEDRDGRLADPLGSWGGLFLGDGSFIGVIPRLMERCRGDIVCSCRPERSSGCRLNWLGWAEVEVVGKVGEDGRDDRSTRTLSIRAGGAVGGGKRKGFTRLQNVGRGEEDCCDAD